MSHELDAAIELQLDIARVAASAQGDVLRILRRMERELIAEVSASTYTAWRKARVEKQLQEIRAAIDGYYAQAAGVATETGSAVAGVAARATTVALGASATMPGISVLRSLASDVMVQGAPLADWWARQSADTTFRYGQAVRQGIAASETNQQIVRRVQDFMEVSRAQAAALVQTSTAAVANDARMAVYQENSDIIQVLRAVATLDSSTCFECAPLDGLEWTIEGEPIDHDEPLPEYPKHYGCRCLLAGRISTEPPGGMRAARGGGVSASTTFSEWLETQSQEAQDRMLGPGRADMYRAGTITLNDLTNGRGRPLTLDELRSKYE